MRWTGWLMTEKAMKSLSIVTDIYYEANLQLRRASFMEHAQYHLESISRTSIMVGLGADVKICYWLIKFVQRYRDVLPYKFPYGVSPIKIVRKQSFQEE